MVRALKRSSPASPLIDPVALRIDAELEKRRRQASTFTGFIQKVEPTYVFYRHCVVLVSVLERVASGELKNVLIMMPPRHSKSETVSRLFTAYCLWKFPKQWVGLSCYGDSLAMSLSMDARERYIASGRRVHEEAAAKKEWRTRDGGGMWASGAGGPITGKGFHKGIIDDPIKNEEEAASDVIREGVNRWYDSTWYTRREPGAAEVILQTRWHEHDLIGYLLEKEREQPRHWHIVCMPALKEEYQQDFPFTCTVEPDWREEGVALCPERYDSTTLNLTRKNVGIRTWTSLYQQRPTAQDGDVWKSAWFKRFKLGEEPKLSQVGYDWDAAYTEKETNSACAYIKAGVSGKDIYVLDADFKWLEFPALLRWMIEQEGPHFVEDKASGKSVVQVLKANGIFARAVKIKGDKADKVSRARLASPAAETGRIFIAEHIADKILHDPRQGLLKFPNGSHNDLNDAFVQAVNRLYHRPTFRFTSGGHTPTTSTEEPDEQD